MGPGSAPPSTPQREADPYSMKPLASGRLRLALGRQERLRKSAQFQAIYVGGRRLKGPNLIIYLKPNQLQFSRLGLSVSKKRFKLSVQRHRLQRLLREAYRRNKRRFLPGHDLIFSLHTVRPEKLRFADIQQELLFLAQKAQLLKTNPDEQRPNS